MHDPLRRFWEPEIETMPPEQLQRLQNERLRKQIAYVYHNSPFYRRRFDAVGVKPEMIQTVADLVRVPMTTKEDYEAAQALVPPYGDMLCVPEEQLSRYWTTSGSTGKPRVFGTTTNDYLDYLESAARVLWIAGVRPGKRVMVPFGHGHWIGLWGVYDAAWYKIGAQIIPVGGYDTRGRILKMKELRVNFLCSTPTYAAYISEVAREMGINAQELGVEAVLIAGEPSAPATRRIIEETWGARTVDFYGNTENLSYLGVDCPEKQGFHFWQDRVVVEIVNPETGEPVPEGEEGELIFTNLTVESMPAIRFRSGDLTAILHTPCPCGCTHHRVLYILGRREHVIKMRGLNVYPRVVEELVRSVPNIGSEYRVIFERERGLDQLRLQVEPLPGVDDQGRERIKQQILDALKMRIGISATIDLLPHGTLLRSEQKAKRIIDNRFLT